MITSMRTLMVICDLPRVPFRPLCCFWPDAANPSPPADDAKKFLDDAEVKLNDLGIEAGRAAWVQENFITDDTEALSAASGQRAGDEAVRLAKQAKQFDGVQAARRYRRAR